MSSRETFAAFSNGKLTGLEKSFSNIKWCVRTNNATDQKFGIIRLNVITEEV